MKKFISFEVEKAVRKNLSIQAFMEGRSRSKILQQLVDEYLETHQEWKPIRAGMREEES